MNEPDKLGILGRLKFLAKDSLIYGGADALSRLFGLVTFPLLARHFSVEEYGIIDFFSVLTTLLSLLPVFGQDSAVARYFYEYTDAPSRRQLISQSLVLQVFLVSLMLPTVWVFGAALGERIVESAETEILLRLVLLQVPFVVAVNFSQNILKWTFSRAQFMTLSVGSTIFTAATIVTCITAFNPGVFHVFALFLATRVVFGVLGIWFVRRWLEVPRGFGHLRVMMKYAAPYGIICIAGTSLPAMDRMFILGFLDESALGAFAAGTKIAILISLPIQAFQMAWGPFALSISRDPNVAATYNWILKGFTIGIFTLVLCLSAVAEPMILLLASDRFAGASAVVFGMAMGAGVQGVGWITEIGISLSKKSYLKLYGYGAAMLTSIIAIYFMIGFFGLAGVAWGGMLGMLVKALMEGWLAQRAYPLSWSYSGVLGAGALTLAVGAVGQGISAKAGMEYGAMAYGSGALLLAAFSWHAVFNSAERKRLKEFSWAILRSAASTVGFPRPVSTER